MPVSSRPYLIKAAHATHATHTPGGEVTRFDGADHGLPGITLMLSRNPPGGSVPGHTHPADEIYVVVEGRGVYTIDGTDVSAEAGDVVIVPANARHSFRSDGDSPLRHVAVYVGDRFMIDLNAPENRA